MTDSTVLAMRYLSEVLSLAGIASVGDLTMFECHGIHSCRQQDVSPPRCADMLLEMRRQLSSPQHQLMEDKP